MRLSQDIFALPHPTHRLRLTPGLDYTQIRKKELISLFWNLLKAYQLLELSHHDGTLRARNRNLRIGNWEVGIFVGWFRVRIRYCML